MIARAGSEITIINGVEYETPRCISFFKSPKGSIMYLTGTFLRDNLDGKGRHYAGTVCNVTKGTFVDLTFETIRKQMNELFQIRNVDGIEYHLPLRHMSEVDKLIKNFGNKKENAKEVFKFRYQKYNVITENK